jgi:hypothetical protein
VRAGRHGLFHQRRNGPPGIARLVGIDAVEAEHHGGIKHAAGIVANLERRAGPGGEVAVAGAIDKNVRTHRLAARLGFHHQRIDAAVVLHDDTGAKRVKENVDLVVREQIVGRDLVGRGIIGLREDFSQDQMGRVQPAEPIDPRKQIGRDALHHPMHRAMHIGMQPAEIGDTRGCPHAAEKAVALDQERAPSRARGGYRRGDAGGAAAEDGDFILAIDWHLPCRFLDRL